MREVIPQKKGEADFVSQYGKTASVVKIGVGVLNSVDKFSSLQMSSKIYT